MKSFFRGIANSIFPMLVKPVVKTEKELATEKGEPYVNVVTVDFPEDDAKRGSFELDWNDIFIDFLIKNGYNGTNDEDIVNNWFNDIARNIVFEANQEDSIIKEAPLDAKVTKLDQGRTEYS